jgi:hypothetical protein
VADAFNQLNSGSLSNTVGNTALTTGLADKFDIIISALLGANASSITTKFSLFVDLIGTETPTDEDLVVICQIVTFSLADQLKINSERISCQLEEDASARTADRVRYLAKMDVKPADRLKTDGTADASLPRICIGTFLLMTFAFIATRRS